ncbi:50S ribosomal protein L31, partial [Vibrio parahaemolyticus]
RIANFNRRFGQFTSEKE